MFSRKTVISLIVYFVLATALAALTKFGYLDAFNAKSNGYWAALLNEIIFVGWTPAVAAFVTWKMLGNESRKSSWTGNSNIASLGIAAVPALVLGLYGIDNTFGLNRHGLGFMLGAMLFVYAVGEEIGWRGFMHDRLAPLPIWQRSLIIVLPWFLWHLPTSFEIIAFVKVIGILGLASYFLCKISEESRSWLILGGFHSIGNIGFTGSAVDLPSNERLMLAGICFVLMLGIYQWQKRNFVTPNPPL